MPHDSAPTAGHGRPLRIAMLCLHTSPLMQPGQRDAGGMNVYVRRLGAALAAAGHRVDLITLWRDAEHPHEPRPAQTVTARTVSAQQLPPDTPDAAELRLVTVTLPSTAAATKDELAGHLSETAEALLTADPAVLARPDLLHGHYWLSAEVGRLLAARWELPLAVTFHTTARAKNRRAAAGETPESIGRERGEQRLIETAGAVVVSTAAEARELSQLYRAEERRLSVIAPGVDLAVFSPEPRRATDPAQAPGRGEGADRGMEADRGPVLTIGFAGRLQALKGPQILVAALGLLRRPDPDGSGILRPRLWLAGVGDDRFTRELHEQAREAGVARQITWLGSLPVDELAERMRHADLWAVPSSSETFGLVALEAQACGTPVAASRVGGLPSAVRDGATGWLVEPRTPQAWAQALRRIAEDAPERTRRGGLAAERARGFSWTAAARAHVDDVYRPLLRGSR